MADRKLTRAQTGLALASALVVLLASVVAVSRISDRDDGNLSTTGSTTGSAPTSPPAGAPAGPPQSPALTGPDSGGLDSGGPSRPEGTENAGVPGEGTATAVTAPVIPRQAAATGSGEPAPAGPGGTPSPDGTPDGGPGAPGDEPGRDGGPDGPDGEPGGTPSDGQEPPPDVQEPPSDGQEPSPDVQEPPSDGQEPSPDGQEPPPAPSEEPPPGQAALVSASVSAGEGAEGAVVALSLADTAPEVDVTVGTTQLVGDHPPSDGTGVMLGGELFQPQTTLPAVAG